MIRDEGYWHSVVHELVGARVIRLADESAASKLRKYVPGWS